MLFFGYESFIAHSHGFYAFFLWLCFFHNAWYHIDLLLYISFHNFILGYSFASFWFYIYIIWIKMFKLWPCMGKNATTVFVICIYYFVCVFHNSAPFFLYKCKLLNYVDRYYSKTRHVEILALKIKEGTDFVEGVEFNLWHGCKLHFQLICHNC